MQTVTFEHLNHQNSVSLKTRNQFKSHRRDAITHRAIFAAVREWEATLPGQSQDRIVQLVAEQWAKEGGRGITVSKQNLYRYLKNENNSSKYTAYVMQLAPAIIHALPLLIARKYGWRLNEKTKPEQLARSMKEDDEADRAVLLDLPQEVQEKEIFESIYYKAQMLRADLAGPILEAIQNIAPQLF